MAVLAENVRLRVYMRQSISFPEAPKKGKKAVNKKSYYNNLTHTVSIDDLYTK